MPASYLGPSDRAALEVFVWENEEVLKVHLCSAEPFSVLHILLVLGCGVQLNFPADVKDLFE
jgi:hypothetical protein